MPRNISRQTLALSATLSSPLSFAPPSERVAVAAESASPYISVGTARTRKTVIAIADFLKASDSLESQVRTIDETVRKDLAYMDLFRFLERGAFVEKPGMGITLDRFRLTDWSSIGAEFLVKANLALDSERGVLALEAYLYDVGGAKQLIGKRYLGAPGDAKSMGHTLAGDIVAALTGLPGIFQTKIAMSCDRTGKKEIYVMDFDGSNVKQATQHRSIAFAPAWSPDGTKIAYSLYARHRDNVKNIDLYELDFIRNSIRMLSDRKGINSGASYAPDGKKLSLTMSFLGNPEIFTLDPGSHSVTRLTKSFGFDVDPAFSPDGKQIAFVSSRSGVPMVYSMNADGSQVKRLTYAGRYNATPSWSPQNDKIAFAGWIEGRFDVFIMNPDGTHIERLTKNQGNNEDPAFSPDGQFIVFSSNRTGQKNVYVMNTDGTYARRLTYGLGNCVAPRWSPVSRNAR